MTETPDTERRLRDVEEELRELRASVNTTRTHGILYYGLLVVIIFFGFAIGYATHTLWGVLAAAVGLALIAFREMQHYRERVAAIDMLVAEKSAEKAALEARRAGGTKSE